MARSDSPLSGKKPPRGFTLTEIAIVIGIIGLILGAIWVAASRVYSNYIVQQVETLSRDILNGTYNAMNSNNTVFGVPYGASCGGTQWDNGTGTNSWTVQDYDITPLLGKMSIVPKAFLNTSGMPVFPGSNAQLYTTIRTITGCGSHTSNSTGSNMYLTYLWTTPIPAEICTKWLQSNMPELLSWGLVHVCTGTAGDCSGGAGPANSPAEFRPIATMNNITAWCSVGQNVTGWMEFAWPPTPNN